VPSLAPVCIRNCVIVLDKAGPGERYHVLSCEAKLESLLPALVSSGEGMRFGDGKKTPGLFDELACIRVLCGVPEPDAVVVGLYSILKPGGRMVICEHVVNSGNMDAGGTIVGRALHRLYMMMGWSRLMGGCELTRETLGSL
jgi:hypothetical protein